MSALSLPLSVEVQPVGVLVSAPNTGLHPADLARLMTDKIVFVGPDVPPAIRDQAIAFQDRVLAVSLHYLTQMERSARTTMIGQLEQAGEHQAAEILRKL